MKSLFSPPFLLSVFLNLTNAWNIEEGDEEMKLLSEGQDSGGGACSNAAAAWLFPPFSFPLYSPFLEFGTHAFLHSLQITKTKQNKYTPRGKKLRENYLSGTSLTSPLLLSLLLHVMHLQLSLSLSFSLSDLFHISFSSIYSLHPFCPLCLSFKILPPTDLLFYLFHFKLNLFSKLCNAIYSTLLMSSGQTV